MYRGVVEVKCLEDFQLALAFDDGKSGVFDCKPLLAKGGVFSRLRDPEVFRRVKVNRELGVVTWDDEIDIAPETAYSQATGAPLPDWMDIGEPAHPSVPAAGPVLKGESSNDFFNG
jgi:hypothetical protein